VAGLKTDFFVAFCSSTDAIAIIFISYLAKRGTLLVAQLIEALRYKLEGRGFDSHWCHWNFSLTKSFRPHCCPGVDSASERKDYQEYFLGGRGGRCVGLTTLTLSCADCLEIWEPRTPGNLRACPGLQWDCFIFLFSKSERELPDVM
jgi:hypothetical protein